MEAPHRRNRNTIKFMHDREPFRYQIIWMSLAKMRAHAIRMQHHRTQARRTPHPLLVVEDRFTTVKAHSIPLRRAARPHQAVALKTKS